MTNNPPPEQIQEPSPVVQIKEMVEIIFPPPHIRSKEQTQNENLVVIRDDKYLDEYKSVSKSDILLTLKRVANQNYK